MKAHHDRFAYILEDRWDRRVSHKEIGVIRDRRVLSDDLTVPQSYAAMLRFIDIYQAGIDPEPALGQNEVFDGLIETAGPGSELCKMDDSHLRSCRPRMP